MTPAGISSKNYIDIFDRYLTLQYKSRFLKDRVGLDAKLYGIQFVRDINALIIPGSALLPPGLTITAPTESYRLGFSIDGDASLPLRNRLLWGGDVFHEWVPAAQVTFPDIPAASLPIACPLQSFDAVKGPVFVPGCPLPFVFNTSRTVAALYLSDQFRPVSRLILDAGVRYQVGLGDRGYKGALIAGNGQLLGSASLVWNFYQDMHLKANYANGFRPPVFNNTDSNGAAVQFGGNRNLSNEQSQAVQGEWNARLLKNIGPIRALQLRADYAYTELTSLIVISNGTYTNRRSDDSNATQPDPSRRRIHSVEAAARLFAGDHTISLGYTFLHITTNDKGLLRNMPQQWFTLGWVLSLIPGWLEQNGTLLVIGGYDDPNRLRTLTLADGTSIAPYSDLTFDKLPPQAILNLGARVKFLKNRLWSSINFYNVLNQRYFFPDPFYDLAPTVEISPTPAPGWSFFFQVGGKPW
jgi:outer membrane receptor protein involved in Fe transport